MSLFIYKARRKSGEIYTDKKEAADQYELYKILRDSGDEVVSFKEKKSDGHASFSLSEMFMHVKTIEKINFARNLGSMIQAGLALSRALSVLERQTKNLAFKGVITQLIESISQGASFSDSLAQNPKVFPQIFISMVHAGEQSGTLADSLKVIAAQMESTYALEKRVKGAMMYPAVIVFAMCLIAILMFIFVVPTLLKTFTELNVELPASTQLVLTVSNLLQFHGIAVLFVLIIAASAFYFWSKTKSGKFLLHKVYLKLPVIGSLVQEVNAARTARTLSSLLGSGVDVVESVTITANVVQNVHYKEVLENAAESIKKGGLMSKIFSEYEKLYPILFAEMLSVGEETGKIGEMLMGVAKYYEEDVSQKTKDMSTVIEPFLILMIGAAVGFFALSMITPLYSLMTAI